MEGRQSVKHTEYITPGTHLGATALNALKVTAPLIVAQLATALEALLTLCIALGLSRLGKLQQAATFADSNWNENT